MKSSLTTCLAHEKILIEPQNTIGKRLADEGVVTDGRAFWFRGIAFGETKLLLERPGTLCSHDLSASTKKLETILSVGFD